VKLSPTQEESIKKVDLLSDYDEIAFFADIVYKNGIKLSVSYLREDFMDDYTRLLNNEFESYTIDFLWPEGNTVTASKESLSGEKVTLTSEELMRISAYDVYADNGTEVLRYITGSLLIYDDDYYYVDFKEIGYDVSELYGFYPSDYKKLDAHKITDQTLILNLAGAENRYYDDNLGFFYDDDFTEKISAVFIVFVFAVIPLAVCILFLIFTIRSKAIYRKLYAAVTLISAAELAIFTILAVMINILPK